MSGRYVVVSTMLRGVVDPPEPVDDATQARMADQDYWFAQPDLQRLNRPFGHNGEYWHAGEDGHPVRVSGVRG
jgi:hypothetical protein